MRKAYKPVVAFVCECAGNVTVTIDPGGEWALVHSLPYCSEFETMDPAEYLKRNRQRIAKGDN